MTIYILTRLSFEPRVFQSLAEARRAYKETPRDEEPMLTVWDSVKNETDVVADSWVER